MAEPAAATSTASERATNPPSKATLPNPLIVPWLTPFGIAPFDTIEPQHYAAAFDLALAEHLAEIDAIAADPAPPTFANTIRALETSGALLTRIGDLFFNLSSADTNDALQEIERDLAPRLSRHDSAIYQNSALFQRISALYEARCALDLPAEDARVLERIHTAFVRAGAKLDGKTQARVAEIKSRLAELVTQFSQNVLADEQEWHMMLETEADLDGLPPSVRASAASAATALGKPGLHAITLARSSVESFLQFSARRDLREVAFKAWTKRGEINAARDNRPIVSEVVLLRTELAKLIGYDSYAHYSLDDQMAGSPVAARKLLEDVWPHAVSKARDERQALQRIVDREGETFAVAAWDWRLYAEKERKARYDLDEGDVRPFLQLDNMIAAAFDTAHRLFGLSFEERSDVPVYHPDVRVWEVTASDGRHVGLFLGDYFSRPSKRSGAWMSAFRSQHKLDDGATPIIVNVMNFARGGDGEPTLLSFDDARTLFHEFGHALHGLLSDVTYPSIAGTNVARDFVELPSQLYEHWLSRPEVLSRFALHVTTGQPMSKDLLDKLAAARTFNQGFSTVEFTASALVDLALHERTEADALDVTRFEAETLAQIGMPDEIVMRHRIPHFLHIMGGYASGYYSYLWSEVMDADAFAAFEETGDIYHGPTANRLARHIYSAGNSKDAAAAYTAFRGRMPEIGGLLKKRGFA